MFNLLLALIVGLVIGWNFHSFFMQLNPPNILKNEINITQASLVEDSPNKASVKVEKVQEPIEVVTLKPVQKIIPKEKNVSTPIAIPINDNFYTLLEKNLFSDAMSLYVDALEPQLRLYHATLVEYFEKKIKTDPQMAIEQMLEVHELHELEADSKKVNEEEFHNIEYNENQQEQAMLLLELIKKNEHETKEYIHQFSLKKVGEHFTLDVQLNGNPLTLLLDTGATLTMVNENKLPSLTILKENITLNTAGGKITSQLQEADNFSVGEIELEKFQIVSSSFEQKEADGLLGMNFFKKFKFKIDQKEAILFLSPKD